MSKFTESIENLYKIQKLQTEITQLLTKQYKIFRDDLRAIIFSFNNIYDACEENTDKARLYWFIESSFDKNHKQFCGIIEIRHMVADLERLKDLCE
jgi:hypothetical protein